MSSAGSITRLVEQLKEGEHGPALPLWQLYYPRMVAPACNKLGATPRRVADEEDVAVSAFKSLVAGAPGGRFPGLDDRAGLWRWLAQLTHDKAVDLIKKHHRRKRGGGRVLDEAALASPEDESGAGGLDALPGEALTPVLAAELDEEFGRLLDRLVDTPRRPLRRVAGWRLEGYTNQEIARMTGKSVPTVGRWMATIRTLLKGP